MITLDHRSFWQLLMTSHFSFAKRSPVTVFASNSFICSAVCRSLANIKAAICHMTLAVMSRHIEHTAGPTSVLPSTPTGSENGRQQAVTQRAEDTFHTQLCSCVCSTKIYSPAGDEDLYHF